MAPAQDKTAAKPQPTSRAWDALTPALSEWILEAVSSMGFERMTPVQASTIPLFTGNKDVVVEVWQLFMSGKARIRLTSDLGCDWQRKDTGLPGTHCGEAAQAGRAHTKAPYWCHYHIPY